MERREREFEFVSQLSKYCQLGSYGPRQYDIHSNYSVKINSFVAMIRNLVLVLVSVFNLSDREFLFI
jgi:hypothetical protein